MSDFIKEFDKFSKMDVTGDCRSLMKNPVITTKSDMRAALVIAFNFASSVAFNDEYHETEERLSAMNAMGVTAAAIAKLDGNKKH